MLFIFTLLVSIKPSAKLCETAINLSYTKKAQEIHKEKGVCQHAVITIIQPDY